MYDLITVFAGNALSLYRIMKQNLVIHEAHSPVASFLDIGHDSPFHERHSPFHRPTTEKSHSAKPPH